MPSILQTLEFSFLYPRSKAQADETQPFRREPSFHIPTESLASYVFAAEVQSLDL